MKKPITALLVAFALFAALASAAPMSGMPGMAMEMSVSSEFDFLAGMVPHHQEASDNARTALERSERPEVRQLAQEIIDAQEAEITQMETWLNEWYPERNQEPVVTAMNQMMASMNMPDLESASRAAFDQAFLEGMIMHHQMAIQMVDSLLNQNLVEHDAVRTLAQNICSSQEAEISEMQGYLEEWYGETAEGDTEATKG